MKVVKIPEHTHQLDHKHNVGFFSLAGIAHTLGEINKIITTGSTATKDGQVFAVHRHGFDITNGK